MRIALVVDNPSRDLPGLVLLGSRLATGGATVYLAPMNLQAQELPALGPDLAVLNCLRRTNQELAAALLDAGVRLAVLDTEGGVMESPGTYRRVMAEDAELRARVGRVCFWGERLARAAREGAWYPDGAIRVTGAPRFDLYAPPWREAARERSPRPPDLAGPVVLVNSSFTLANPRFQTADEEAEMLVARLGLDRAKVEHRLAAERAGLAGYLRLAPRLARRFPGATIVYRPHPFERIETYRELEGVLPNLRVIPEGTVEGWLLESRAVIQLSSTTAVEAALAGVPSLSTDWLPTWHRLEPVEAVSLSCAGEEDLEDRLEELLDGTGAPPLTARAREVVREWFFELDGDAHRRVASALRELVEGSGGSTGPDRRLCRRLHYRPDREGPRQRASSSLRRSLRLPRSWSFRRMAVAGGAPRWDRSRKAFDRRTVASWLEAFARRDPDLARVSARPAGAAHDYLVPFPDGRTTVLEHER